MRFDPQRNVATKRVGTPFGQRSALSLPTTDLFSEILGP